MKKTKLFSARFLCGLTLCGVVASVIYSPTVTAQDVSSEDSVRQVFEADYFTEFAPQNALDMIRRVPGFILRISNNDARGLGQRTDNVCLLYTSPSPRDKRQSRMPSSA